MLSDLVHGYHEYLNKMIARSAEKLTDPAIAAEQFRIEQGRADAYKRALKEFEKQTRTVMTMEVRG